MNLENQYINIYNIVKKLNVQNKYEKTNYVANDAVMRWLNKSLATTNVMFQLLDIIFSVLTNLCLTVCALVVISSTAPMGCDEPYGTN